MRSPLQAATFHAATRRELLLGSGVLFAWAFVPRLARAEGRDPRFLTIVLRGGLDGLAAVAPVGDPDWVKLRGKMRSRSRATSRGCGSMASSRSIRDAERAPALSGGPRHDRACGRHALSGALAFRRPGYSGKRAI